MRAAMSNNPVTDRAFGNLPDGREMDLFTLSNRCGLACDITNYGGIVTAIRVMRPDQSEVDVALGFNNLKGYLGPHPYFHPRRLGEAIPVLLHNHGDNHFTRRSSKGELARTGILRHPASGLTRTTLTTQDNVQIYSAAILDGTLLGKSGVPYIKHAGLCLECQGCPAPCTRPHSATSSFAPATATTTRRSMHFRLRGRPPEIVVGHDGGCPLRDFSRPSLPPAALRARRHPRRNPVHDSSFQDADLFRAILRPHFRLHLKFPWPAAA